eukprot:10822217-Alexandrium_andersonii.AAC.1
MAAIRASRLPAEVDPDQPFRHGNTWSAGSECEACSLAIGRVHTRLVAGRADAALAMDCPAGQVASVVKACVGRKRARNCSPVAPTQ